MNQTTTTTKPLEVLSLFDGISCGRQALERANIPVSNYYSSEISSASLNIQNWNYSADSTFHQIGDVKLVNGADYPNVSIIQAGSPCTSLSSVNPKDKSGLAGPESSLFYEFIRIVKEVKATKKEGEKLYVLLENVASMQIKERDKITNALSEALGEDVQPIKIDSADLGAPAHRRRYYWCNWSNSGLKNPSGKDLCYQDILVNGYAHFEEKKASTLLSNNITLTNGINRKYSMSIGNIIYKDKSFADLPIPEKLAQYPAILEASNYKGQAGSAVDEYSFPNGCYRVPSVLESEALMTIKPGHVSDVKGVSKTEKYKCIGLGWTVDVITALFQNLKQELK